MGRTEWERCIVGPIECDEVQSVLTRLTNQNLYLHLETTNGAYAALRHDHAMAVCAYIRNGKIKYVRGTITGDGPYRVGLKTEDGWIYGEGLTDYEINAQGQLLLAGHDEEGRLAIALELSQTPFSM